MKFQRLTIVQLKTPAAPAPDTSDDTRIQSAHVAYLTGLRDRGIIALNGPVRHQDSPALRGLSIYTVDVDEARALAHQDPAVKAGWFEVVVDGWWVPSVPVTVGDRVDVET